MSDLGARPPAMLDVARLAGVSHQTVSRVINESPLVRPETVERVRAAIDALGYRPNRTARALATQKSGLIGILASGFPHMGPATTVASIETYARAAGYSAVVGVHADPTADEVAASIRAFVEHGVQGIAVVTPRRSTAETALAEAHGVPTVLIADLVGVDAPAHLVAVDQAEGARLATQLLVDAGARSIVHISGPTGWFDADCRVQGWRATLDAAGLTASEVFEGDWGPDRGYEIGRRLLRGPLPDAVFCANDLTAIGLLAAFREEGVSVPGDVAVVGFDDIPPVRYLDPPLTTVRQPLEQLGERAVEVLLTAIAGGPPTVHALAPELIVRGSTR